jgi:hypothetical protein
MECSEASLRLIRIGALFEKIINQLPVAGVRPENCGIDTARQIQLGLKLIF